LQGLKKIYHRGILSLDKLQRFEVVDGREFKGAIKQFFKQHKVYVRVAVPDRKNQQVLVERKNQLVGTKLWKMMVYEKITSGKSNTDWVENLPKVVAQLNKKIRKKKPKKLADHLITEGNSAILLDIGTHIRVLLNKPEDYVSGEKLHGKFRSTDFKWSVTVHTITNVFLNPGQVLLY
jgi:hypothetical protein